MKITHGILLCLIGAFGHVKAEPVVNTTTGAVRGRVVVPPPGLQATVPGAQFGTVSQFLGVPYAEAPTGALRFAKPVPKIPWSGVRDAQVYGAGCPQDANGMTEDCLFLNIFIPDSAVNTSDHVPVMVWIHGGSFVRGQGSLYDATILSLLGEVVVVTINYRLGILGFLSTADDRMPGNYGLWDQKLALHWVKDNIGNFGGDPDQITIFGESAGSFSVTYQMLTPLNNFNLFRRVIASSGVAAAGLLLTYDGEQLRKQTSQIAAALGCHNTSTLLVCLREAPVSSILSLTSLLEYPIAIDGEFISDRIDGLISSRHFAQYDLLAGTSSNEGSVVIPTFGAPELNTKDFYELLVIWMSGVCQCSNAASLTDVGKLVYTTKARFTDPPENARILFDLIGDSYFNAPTVNFLKQHVDSTATNTYSYYLTYSEGKEALVPAEYLDAIPGSPHGIISGYIFGDALASGNSSNATARFSQDIIAYWTNFAKYGDPNGADLPEWPKFDAENETYLILEPNITTGQHLKADKVAFWGEYVKMASDPLDQNACPITAPVRLKTKTTPENKTVVITSGDGEVLGSIIGAIRIADEAVGGEDVAEFLGIPYAKPPIGDLRYRAPQDTGPWGDEPLGIRDKLPPACPQDIPQDPWMVRAGLTEVSEDCLTLNIYAPLVASNSSLPVVIFIHPGGGTVGTSSVYDAVPLSSNIEAVVVVINHRLGALGFLSTEDEEAPGNYGLHDALASLKWVSKYIGSFGGDSNRITVIGHGSGSVIAHLFVMSEKAQGLFQQAVLMSATGLVRPLSNPVQPSPIEQARILARSVDCPIDSNEVMIKCLREKPALDVAGSSRYSPFEIPFRPIIDGDILTADPRALLKSGTINNVDLIIGMAQDEVSAVSFPLFFSNISFCPTQEEAEGIIAVVSQASFNNPEKAAVAFSTEYLGQKGMEDECLTRGSVRQFVQDMLTVSPTLEAAELHAALGNDVFLYSFDHEPSSHYYSFLPPQAGPAFGDDLQFLFGDPYSSLVDEYKLTYRLQDKQISLEMMTLWKNFIHKGHPGQSLSGVEWPAYDQGNPEYMRLGACPMVHSDDNWPHILRFWSDLIPSITAPSAVPTRSTTPPFTTEEDHQQPCIIGEVIGLALSTDEAFILITVLVGVLVGTLVLSLLCFGGCLTYKSRYTNLVAKSNHYGVYTEPYLSSHAYTNNGNEELSSRL